MPTRRTIALVPLFVTLVAGLAACAKQPVPSSSTAQAPPRAPATAVVAARPAASDPRPASTAGAPAAPVHARATTTPRLATPPAPSEFSPIDALKDIHFDFDRYEVRPEDARVLDTNLSWLRLHPTALVLIEGHCDDRGTNVYNLSLGDRRAKAVVTYLVSHGVRASRIATISYGEERPRCTGADEDCRASNRRAHFLVKER